MTGTSGLYQLGIGALLAQRAGVATAGRNTANAQVRGYRRQDLDLGTQTDGGVQVNGVLRADDAILASRERLRSGSHAYAERIATALDDLDQVAGGTNLVDAVAALFGGFIDLTSAPSDPQLRAQAVSLGSALSARFRDSAAQIAASRDAASRQITQLSAEATALAREIAKSNQALQTHPSPELADKRDLAAEKLAELVGGNARIDPDGHLRFALADGTLLVDGSRAAQVVASPSAALGGQVQVSIVDGNFTKDVTSSAGGEIGGALAFRDGTALDAAARLDQLAYDLARGVNATHRAGAGLDGAGGRDFFVEPGQVAGAAAAMAVDPALLADHGVLATAALGAGPGSTGGAQALAALADAPLAGGGTRRVADEAIDLFAGVGRAAAQAAETLELEGVQLDTLRGLRDALSGVSPEEELVKLTQFQRAHEAATRFVATVDEMLGDLIARV